LLDVTVDAATFLPRQVDDTGWWTPATPVVVVEHDMDTVASADWVIDLGQGAGDEGGLIVAAGPPAKVAWVEAPHRTSRSGSLPARRRAA
jgi:hypothetical protein